MNIDELLTKQDEDELRAGIEEVCRDPRRAMTQEQWLADCAVGRLLAEVFEKITDAEQKSRIGRVVGEMMRTWTVQTPEDAEAVEARRDLLLFIGLAKPPGTAVAIGELIGNQSSREDKDWHARLLMLLQTYEVYMPTTWWMEQHVYLNRECPDLIWSGIVGNSGPEGVQKAFELLPELAVDNDSAFHIKLLFAWVVDKILEGGARELHDRLLAIGDRLQEDAKRQFNTFFPLYPEYDVSTPWPDLSP